MYICICILLAALFPFSAPVSFLLQPPQCKCAADMLSWCTEGTRLLVHAPAVLVLTSAASHYSGVLNQNAVLLPFFTCGLTFPVSLEKSGVGWGLSQLHTTSSCFRPRLTPLWSGNLVVQQCKAFLWSLECLGLWKMSPQFSGFSYIRLFPVLSPACGWLHLPAAPPLVLKGPFSKLIGWQHRRCNIFPDNLSNSDFPILRGIEYKYPDFEYHHPLF